VPRGSALVIPEGAITIRIGDDGLPVMDPVVPLSQYQAWPDWMEIAIRHCRDAKEARASELAAIESGDEESENVALTAEFHASLQAITACAFALDAFYARIQQFAPVSDEDRERRKAQRWPRSKWVYDAVRRSTQPMSNDAEKALKAGLTGVYRLRDQAVHPAFELTPYIVHAGARIAVPEVMATFRVENAEAALAISVEAILRVADMPRAGDDELAQVAHEASTTAHQIVDGVVHFPDDWPMPPADTSAG
jgi:hypothetical protein